MGSSSQGNTHQPSPGRSAAHLEWPWGLRGNQRTPANFQRAKDPVLCRTATAPLYQLESTIMKSEAFRDLSLRVIQNPSWRRPPSTPNTRKQGALGCTPGLFVLLVVPRRWTGAAGLFSPSFGSSVNPQRTHCTENQLETPFCLPGIPSPLVPHPHVIPLHSWELLPIYGTGTSSKGPAFHTKHVPKPAPNTRTFPPRTQQHCLGDSRF